MKRELNGLKAGLDAVRAAQRNTAITVTKIMGRLDKLDRILDRLDELPTRDEMNARFDKLEAKRA